jgi:hypothetical protein
MSRKNSVIEIGEGRSKSIYIEPTVNDTAILMAYFNPAKFKRLLRNIMYIMQILKEKNIPHFVVECVFNNETQEIPEADLVLHSNSYMFYKEQLLEKLEKIVPEQYTKIVCLDADIMFDMPDWVDHISKLLDRYDVIQPFDQACWLVPDNTRIKSKKLSYAYGIVHRKLTKYTHDNSLHVYHPGFAWAFKRDIFRKLGGFYDRSIIGNGDLMFSLNFFKDTLPFDFLTRLKKTFGTEKWTEYHANFKKVNPSIGYLRCKSLHLFHGIAKNRQYKTRYASVAHLLTKSWDETITLNKDGLYEFKDASINPLVLQYFKGRNEDIPLETANAITELESRHTRRVHRMRRHTRRA